MIGICLTSCGQMRMRFIGVQHSGLRMLKMPSGLTWLGIYLIHDCGSYLVEISLKLIPTEGLNLYFLLLAALHVLDFHNAFRELVSAEDDCIWDSQLVG